MIAVETVIRKLVSEYEFVIIPGFGALLSHQIPASYDKESRTFSPPVKKLAFNEFLKLDDGLLANFISREEKMTHLDAVSHVRRYTDILRTSLQVEGETSISGIGEFKSNSEGKLVFEPNTENHFKDEWYGFRKVTAEIYETPFAHQIGVSKADTSNEEVEVLELDAAKTMNLNWLRWASAAMLAGIICYVSLFLLNSNTDNKSTLNPFDNLFGSTSFGKSKDVAVHPVKLKIQKDKLPVLSPVVRPDSLTYTSQPALVKVDSTVAIADAIDSEKRFYLVAGAFKGTKQAKVLLQELQAKGFDDAMIIPATKYSSKVKVAVQAYAIEKDAYRASARLKGVLGETAWVFKRR